MTDGILFLLEALSSQWSHCSMLALDAHGLNLSLGLVLKEGYHSSEGYQLSFFLCKAKSTKNQNNYLWNPPFKLNNQHNVYNVVCQWTNLITDIFFPDSPPRNCNQIPNCPCFELMLILSLKPPSAKNRQHLKGDVSISHSSFFW